MQAEKGSSPTSAPVRTRLHRASRDFSRWARGGSAKPSTPATPLLQRTLASAGRPQDAQSILEFLLVSVPLLALIFGILEIGLAFYESTNLDYAASEAARTVSVCANICDYLYNGTLYRDYNMLRTLNQVNIRLDNIEYVLVQHVGEQIDDPGGTTFPDLGRAGPDIYANYKYHWQLYALPKPSGSYPANDPRVNTVGTRSGGDPLGVKLADAKCNQIPLLTVAANPGNCALAWASYDDQFNGYRSGACFSGDADTICRKNIPKSDQYGQPTGQTQDTWPGRYICIPTDRFYVQIVYRHNWITPFMPTLNLDGKTQTLKGFGSTNSLILSSKAYQKVEPRQFAGTSGQAGC
ncbi:MAG: pilus assembly protein [Chloroflexi bacterium]|nr:pilus assembly protein [Chloroflexota bacterium]OJV94200.1 MAG: hypothetical protein BGO39_12105 [Chloroflexi bacterium 54-19]